MRSSKRDVFARDLLEGGSERLLTEYGERRVCLLGSCRSTSTPPSGISRQLQKDPSGCVTPHPSSLRPATRRPSFLREVRKLCILGLLEQPARVKGFIVFL